MKTNLLNFLIIFLLFIIVSCASSDKVYKDTTPPLKPILIPHLGSIGDNEWLSDDNNGIDALPDGEWIRIQWHKLLDNDLKIIRIYRFAKDLNQNPVKIDSIGWNNEEYIDRLLPESVGQITAIETDWHYFIKVLDHANNYTVSDTVKFKLIQKPILTEPEEDAVFSNSSQITFRWRKQSSSTRLRLLLFDDETGKLIWHYDEINITEEIIFQKRYDGNPLPAGSYTWRVDSRGDMDYDGNYFNGSKSKIRKLFIQ